MHSMIEEDFDRARDLVDNEIAVAILVLASAIRDSATFNISNAENFGHELALALKNVISESTFEVEITGEQEVALRTLDTFSVELKNQ